MPYAPDKARINGNGARGMSAAIQAEYDSLNHLGAEIVENGWEAETVAWRDEMKKECKRHHDSEVTHYNFLREMVEKWADFVDAKKDAAKLTPSQP